MEGTGAKGAMEQRTKKGDCTKVHNYLFRNRIKYFCLKGLQHLLTPRLIYPALKTLKPTIFTINAVKPKINIFITFVPKSYRMLKY